MSEAKFWLGIWAMIFTFIASVLLICCTTGQGPEYTQRRLISAKKELQVERLNAQVEVACINHGGDWTDLSNSKYGCVFNKK